MRALRLAQRLAGVLVWAVAARGQSTPDSSLSDSLPPVTSVATVAVNTLRYLGREVRFHGTVKEIIASGIPLKALLKTGDYTWVASFYRTDSIPEGLVKVGNRVTVTGVVLSISDVMYLGTKMKVPEVMASKVVRAPKPKPAGPRKGPAADSAVADSAGRGQ